MIMTPSTTPAPPTKTLSTSYHHVYLHDMFNLISLSIMIPMILFYCYQTTELHQLGTSCDFGSEFSDLFRIFFSIFYSYLLLDTLVIFLYPSCVVTDRKSLLFHHALLLPLCLVPYFHARYHWHMMIGLTTEINTFFIILRRQLSPKSRPHMLCNVLFYITWILLKLILFPCLSILFVFEYYYYLVVHINNDSNSNTSNISGGGGEVISRAAYVNVNVNLLIGIAPVIMICLTLLCYKWTYDMLINLYYRKNK